MESAAPVMSCLMDCTGIRLIGVVIVIRSRLTRSQGREAVKEGDTAR